MHDDQINMECAKRIFADVKRSMQAAEEISGPEGEAYLKLMLWISREALNRHEQYSRHLMTEGSQV